jgi:hypothetical protein
MSVEVFDIAGVDIRMGQGGWPLPEALRAEVPASWARMIAANPHLWDGRVLGIADITIDADGVLRGVALEDDYSAFLAWREAGTPEIGVRNLFGSALVLSSDGALILGIMGQGTANAGRVYPAAGSLEPRDVRPDGVVDVAGSTVTELAEETALDAAEAVKGRMIAIFDGPRVCVGQVYGFGETADVLLARIRADLERQAHRELADAIAVRTFADVAAAGEVLPYVAKLAELLEAGRLHDTAGLV